MDVPAQVLGEVRAAEFDRDERRFLSNRVQEQCVFPCRPFLLWDGCVRQRRKYVWPDGFKERFRRFGYSGLNKAMGNGPPRTAFTIAKGVYRSTWELDHLYDRETLARWRLPEGRHFTQSAGLVCMTRELRRWRRIEDLWRLRGLAYLLFGYDPLGALSEQRPNGYGFVNGVALEIFWPEAVEDVRPATLVSEG
jgi:hypothetical protein